MSDNFNLKKPTHILATVFGSGLAPFASGTFGTLASVPLCAVFMLFLPPALNAALLLMVVIVGVWVCDVVSKDLGTHDHGSIVIDELAGLWVTFMFLPEITLFWVCLGFVLFRLFDILKPQPIAWLDKKVHGGVGIMVDDLVAGLMAGCSILLVGACFFN